jgi:hypothetical protein
VLHHLRAFLYLLSGHSRRHHPADALPCSLLLAVVGTEISPSPAAGGAAAATLDVAQNFFGLEAVNRQRALMVARPIAFALAQAIDEQLANAMWME